MGLSSETGVKNRLMVGVSIATVWEFEATLDYFHVQETERITYPYGEYFCRTINGKPVVFYSTGVRKVNGVGGNSVHAIAFSDHKSARRRNVRRDR